MKIRYLPDSFIEEEGKDLLGFNEFAKSTLAAIRYSEPPFTWGIYGDWGSGKTSLMKLIKGRMETDLKNPEPGSQDALHIPVWFNAWEYENELNIIYPLFYAIYRDFSARCKGAQNKKAFSESFKKVALGSLFGLTDLTLRTVTKAAIGEALKLDDVKKALEIVEENLQTVFSKWTDQVAETKQAFKEFVNNYLNIYRGLHPEIGNRELYLAIFVDDLDRCLPDVAIEILERIKNHLTVDKCIFILGVNRNVVYKSIQKKYGDLDIDGRQHLEKIIQYSVGVPHPSEKVIKEFGKKSLSALVLSGNKQKLENYFDEFGQTLSKANFTNPRKIKRVLNRYLNFIAQHVEIDKDINEFNIETTVRLIIIREYHQQFYELFREAGFPAFQAISNHTGDSNASLSKFGEKWNGLVSEIPRMKKLASLEAGRKTANQYCDAIDFLFGLED